MKKHAERFGATGVKRLAVTLAVLAVLLSAVLTLCACGKSDLNAELVDTSYELTFTYDGEDTVVLKEDVLYQNKTGAALDCLKFHLYPNAFAEGVESSPFLESEMKDVYYSGKSYGKIEVLSAKIDRTTCDFELGGTDNTILSLPCSLEDGDAVSVSLDCEITLPHCVSRFGVTKSTVNLTGFYPVLCRYEAGWREDGYCALGDPFYSDAASYYVTASYPTEYVLGAGGSVAETSVEGDVATTEITSENARDFALTLSKNYTRYEANAAVGEGIAVHYLALDDANPQATADLAAKAIETFSSAFGDYPHGDFTVAEAPINSGGMEYGGFVIISTGLSSQSHNDTVVHETAHQWWFNAVGNDQFNEAWLDEGLTEFCTGYYYALTGDASAYKNVMLQTETAYAAWSELPPSIGFDSSMSRNISTFKTQGEYVAVTYEKGSMLFSTLRDLFGDEKFCKCIATYYSDNMYGVATRESLISAFEKNGCRAGGIIRSWTDGSARV